MDLHLSEDEVQLILKKRAAENLASEKEQFFLKSLKTAYEFSVWSHENELGLTFSTFIDSFGYEEPDVKQMYNAVRNILNAASPD